MKIAKLKLSNFRSYSQDTEIDFDDLTVFIGKNDIGKSTVLEALDIFFNDGKGTVKIDNADANVNNAKGGDHDICISVIFKDLPEKIVIDSSVETTLKDEYLLNSDSELEVMKKYSGGKSPKVFIKAQHPSNPNCSDLLLKKNSELKKIVKNENIECQNQSVNAFLRKSIWEHYSSDLKLAETEIDASKEDAKQIWEKLSYYMPVYSLFQSDRKNSDADSEIQDPLKEAVKEILNDENLKTTLNQVADEVHSKLNNVSIRTLAKLKEMDPAIANSLTPVIPPTDSLKWADVFKAVSISGDDIPINKRGSGVRRLILLSFFRAEVERRIRENDNSGVIYAIEEPETSQHNENQRKLIEALKKLAAMPNVQIILTTHSAYIVKHLEFQNLRLITKDKNDIRKISNVQPRQLRYPSLNEVNFAAFDEATEEYHDELYAYIEGEKWMNEYNATPAVAQTQRKYIAIRPNQAKEHWTVTLTTYIRHQIHHPDNNENTRYTKADLLDSINMMRDFIATKNSSQKSK